jgi:hypothetical protein
VELLGTPRGVVSEPSPAGFGYCSCMTCGADITRPIWHRVGLWHNPGGFFTEKGPRGE